MNADTAFAGFSLACQERWVEGLACFKRGAEAPRLISRAKTTAETKTKAKSKEHRVTSKRCLGRGSGGAVVFRA